MSCRFDTKETEKCNIKVRTAANAFVYKFGRIVGETELFRLLCLCNCEYCRHCCRHMIADGLYYFAVLCNVCGNRTMNDQI